MPRTTSIRAVQTRYKGYAFRSRLEARWAVFFDHLGIKWEYEPEGFELGNGLRYLPDFWLPEWRMWVEVKPGPSDATAREKAWRLAEQSGFPVYMSNGMPDGPGTFLVTLSHTPEVPPRHELDVVVGWHKPGGQAVIVNDPRGHRYAKRDGFFRYDQMHSGIQVLCVPPEKPRKAPLSGIAKTALEAARGSRFEFGDVGAA